MKRTFGVVAVLALGLAGFALAGDPASNQHGVPTDTGPTIAPPGEGPSFPPDGLPFTGLSLLALVLFGGAIAGAGVLVRRASTPPAAAPEPLVIAALPPPVPLERCSVCGRQLEPRGYSVRARGIGLFDSIACAAQARAAAAA